MSELMFLETYVSQLFLTKDAYKDTAGAPLVVKVNFVDFPTVEIAECKRFVTEETFLFQFNRGQARYFSMVPEVLVNKMKSIPLRIGVFRVDDSFPICCTSTHLAGCACDLALSVSESAPFKFQGTFQLVDPGDNPAGKVDVDLTVTSFGRFLLTRYALMPGHFIFKSERKGPEYKCCEESFPARNLFPERETVGDHDLSVRSFMVKAAGVSPVAERLALGRPPPKPPRAPLTDPTIVAQQSRKSIVPKKKKGRRK